MTADEKKMYEQMRETSDRLKGLLGDANKVFELTESMLPKFNLPVVIDDEKAEMSIALNGKSVMITFENSEKAMQIFESFRNIKNASIIEKCQ